MKEIKGSSNIAAIDHVDGKLYVKFHSGAEYDYPDVPVEIHDKLSAAHDAGESVGKAFHVLVKSKFTGVKREASK